MSIVLGIKPTMSNSGTNTWGGHDPAACVVKEGEIRAMVEEERFTRRKRAPRPSFPKHSIEYVLDSSGLMLSDIDAIVIGRDHGRYVTDLKNDPLRLLPMSLGSAYDSFNEIARAVGVRRRMPRRQVEKEIRELFGEQFAGEWFEVSHHRCHAASAAYCSGFDEQIVLTIDSSGETDSTVLWDENLERVVEFPDENSIGSFYAAGCYYLGFRGGRDAGKVMGLASYGEPREEFEALFDELVDIGYGTYDVSVAQQKRFEAFEECFGPRRRYPEPLTKRHKDFAYHLQQKTEEIVTALVRYHVEQTGIEKVSLAGGVAMNCKLNREVLTMDVVDDLFVQPAANDSGIALGAALEGCRLLGRKAPNVDLAHTYYGPSYDDEAIESVLESAKLEYHYDENICETVAELLADGRLVGWFQGSMEFGARALGNRSILASPLSRDSLDRVNANVKHREDWRPFAPSLLYEARDEYLVHGDESPFMILLDIVDESKREEIPAITHVDGTTRPQTVKRSANKKYYDLIAAFKKRTGVPVVLNTSFNVAGEPIVESPQQAVADFYTTGLDALAIGNYLITKLSIDVEDYLSTMARTQ